MCRWHIYACCFCRWVDVCIHVCLTWLGRWMDIDALNHRNGNVIILMKFSSLAAPKVVKMTTFSAASDENFVKMTTIPFRWWRYPDSKVHGANIGPTWVLSAPDGPHVGPMNLVIRVHMERRHRDSSVNLRCVYTDPRPRPSPGPRPSWKSGWKRTPCKVYGLYWNSGRGRGWRTWTRARPSVNTFDEMLRRRTGL